MRSAMSMYDPYQPYQPYQPQQPRRQPGVYVWPLLIGLVILLVVVWRLWPSRGASLDPEYKLRDITPAGNLSDAEKAIIQLYRNSAPSVVNVASSQLVRNRFNYNVQKLPKGSGTGFMWDADGHVVTNFHVVQSANEVSVTLA